MYFYLLEHIRDKLKVLSFTECHMGFYYGISVSLLKVLQEYGIWKNMKFKGELNTKVRDAAEKPN